MAPRSSESQHSLSVNANARTTTIGFLAAWLGTVLSRERASEKRYEELRVRALTGYGAEEAEPARV